MELSSSGFSFKVRRLMHDGIRSLSETEQTLYDRSVR